MTLPLLVSVPHAGRRIPPEVRRLSLLSEKDIIADGDEGAAAIYYPIEAGVAAFVTTDIARAFVDMNRREDDRRKDGVVKTHTCWDVEVYRELPSEDIIRRLILKYHRPYHACLTKMAGKARLGVDCHTMAAEGPPVGPDHGQERPPVCLSNAGFTCPAEWLESLARCLERTLEQPVSINNPFQGGFIIRAHSKELPWVQLELSRAPYLSNEEKSRRVLEALRLWCEGELPKEP
ncbi:MAG: N-formylglutamate amidohydrolase [bacterium]|nr:N-formylglutamate amidohydrolase [bacterium]